MKPKRYNPEDESQLFYIRPAIVMNADGKPVEGVYKVFSVMYSDKVLSLPSGDCKTNGMKLILKVEDNDEDELWKISGGKVESYQCSGFVIVSQIQCFCTIVFCQLTICNESCVKGSVIQRGRREHSII